MNSQASVLEDIGKAIEHEANAKVKHAMQLFIRCDGTYKGMVLMLTGFKGELSAQALRGHFDTLDLMDELDDCIENMADDIENS